MVAGKKEETKMPPFINGGINGGEQNTAEATKLDFDPNFLKKTGPFLLNCYQNLQERVASNIKNEAPKQQKESIFSNETNATCKKGDKFVKKLPKKEEAGMNLLNLLDLQARERRRERGREKQN